MRRVLILIALFTLPVGAQVIAVGAGTSDIYQSTGANAVIYNTDSTTSLDFGYYAGKPVIGAGYFFKLRGWDVGLGDSQIAFQQNGGLQFVARGVAVKRKWGMDRRTMLEIFTGAASPAFSSPYFVGYSNAYNFSGGVLFTKDITKALHFESLDFIRGNEHTADQSLSFTKPRYALNASAGVLVNAKTINGAGTVKLAKDFSFSASHSDVFLYNPGDENTPIHTSLNAVGATFTDGFWTAHDMYIESNTGGVIQGGNGIGGGVHFKPVVISLDYFVPKTGHSLLVGTVTERFGRHVSVSEFVSNTNGQTSFNGGGTYTSNELTVSLGYTVDYFPATNSSQSPFQQVLTLSVSFHAPHSSTVNLGSVVLPNRKIEYAVGGSSWFQGPMEAAVSAGGPRHEGSNGQNQYEGVVTLEDGTPLEGAAVLVGKDEAFTDGHGMFVVRSRSKSDRTLRLLPADFTTPIDYECVNCPAKIAANGTPIVVVVRRKL